MTTGTAAAKSNGRLARLEPQGKPVSELVSDEMLKVYGYLALPNAILQKAGSASQTVAAIRSHWPNRKTWADPETIAAAACLDESTVRKRHLPKLGTLGFVLHRQIESRLGQRREYYFTVAMKQEGYWEKGFLTLPRWAALALPEWNYRVVYAAVLQNSLAGARSSRKGPAGLENEEFLSGSFGRHRFSLTDLSEKTGLSRNPVIDAKQYLTNSKWLHVGERSRHGDELFLNLELVIPTRTLHDAYETTRARMFKGKERLNGHA